MKKIVALALAWMLICTVMAASSEEIIQLDGNTMTGNTTVSLTVDNSSDTYIVVIPSRVVIDPKTQYGEGTITLRSGWELISINGLDIKLTAAENGIGQGSPRAESSSPALNDITNASYQNFYMKTSTDKTVSYAIQPNDRMPLTAYENAGSYGSGYRNGGSLYSDSLISVNKGGDSTEDKSCTLTFYVRTMPEAGVYTDTLTFSIVTR